MTSAERRRGTRNAEKLRRNRIVIGHIERRGRRSKNPKIMWSSYMEALEGAKQDPERERERERMDDNGSMEGRQRIPLIEVDMSSNEFQGEEGRENEAVMK